MVWVTRWALSRGIEKHEVTPDEDGVLVPNRNSVYGTWLRPGEFYESEELAMARAEEMRLAKIKSLEKQLSWLRGLRFLGVDGKKA